MEDAEFGAKERGFGAGAVRVAPGRGRRTAGLPAPASAVTWRAPADRRRHVSRGGAGGRAMAAHLSSGRVNLTALREAGRRELREFLDKCAGSKVSGGRGRGRSARPPARRGARA